MAMHIARRISEAVGSWLHLEFCCHRSGLMSEAALKGVVGQVLSAFPSIVQGSRVHAEVPHAALGTTKGGSKRCLDFALAFLPEFGPCADVEVAIEAKWAGSSHCTYLTIVEDLIRLALVKRLNPSARCIFLLAGTAANVKKVLAGRPFTEGTRNRGIQLAGSPRRLTFDSLDKEHRAMFKKTFRNWLPYTSVPASIVTCCHGLYPLQTDQGTVRFQSIAWELTECGAKDLKGTW